MPEKMIKIDNENYLLGLSKTGSLTFCLVRDIVDDWNFEVETHYIDEDINDTKNPLKVLRKICEESSIMIKIYKPKYFHFSANSEKKRYLYEKLFLKYIDMFENYEYIYHEGKFHFYKK